MENVKHYNPDMTRTLSLASLPLLISPVFSLSFPAPEQLPIGPYPSQVTIKAQYKHIKKHKHVHNKIKKIHFLVVALLLVLRSFNCIIIHVYT